MNRSCFPIFLSSILILGCTSAPEKGSETDSLAVAPDTVVAEAAGTTVLENATPPDASLADKDTLFNVLARKGVLAGTFISVEIITDAFIDIRGGKPPRKLLAALMQTGEGQYSGAHDLDYETIHYVLAVFEILDDRYQLITYSDMGDGGGAQLRVYSTEAESLTLANGGEAVMIHSKSSESGAGDYGFRKDEATIFILLNDAIKGVLSFTVEDYQFSSDEQTSSSEQTITGILSISNEMTDGIYDISIRTSTVRSSTGEDTETVDTSEENSSGDNQVDSEVVYKWTGAMYEP